MGDWPTEWTFLRALHIDVNPLVVTGGLGEHVDLLLSDRGPLARTELLANRVEQGQR